MSLTDTINRYIYLEDKLFIYRMEQCNSISSGDFNEANNIDNLIDITKHELKSISRQAWLKFNLTSEEGFLNIVNNHKQKNKLCTKKQ